MSSSQGLPDLPPTPGKGLRRSDDSRLPSRASGPGRALARKIQPTPPAVLAGPPTPASLWRGLQRHLPLALSLGLILGSLAAAAAWSLYNPSRFRATALVRIRSATPTILRDNQGLFEDAGRLADYRTTQSTLIRSDLVLNKALGYNGVSDLPMILAQDDPITWLSTHLQVVFAGEIMKISIDGDRDADVIQIVNAVTDAYLKEVAGNERETRQQRAKTLADTITKQRGMIEERKLALRNLANLAGSNDRPTLVYKQQLQIQAMNSQHRQIDDLDNELRNAQMQLALLTGQSVPAEGAQKPPTATTGAGAEEGTIPDLADAPLPPAVADSAALTTAIESDQAVVAAKSNYLRLQKDRRRLRDAARGSTADPAVRRIEAELQAATQTLNAARHTAREQLMANAQSSQGRPTAKGAPISNDIDFLTRKIRMLEVFKRQAEVEYEARRKVMESLNADTIDLEESQQEIGRLEQMLSQINDQHDRLKVELNSQDRITPVENAARAERLSTKKKVFVAAAAGAGTLGLILLGFAWFDARNRRVGQVGDVVNGLGMELVGVLPALPSARARRANNTANWENLLMESVDATRTMLLHASRTEQIQVVMITSAIKGEGKTSLASHLATSLARARRRTLLVDGDLRSPMLHKLFDLPRTPGLAELLRNEVELADVLQATPAANLTLITAGMVDPDSLAALAEGRVQQLVDATRDQYDFILIDTPPVLPVADTLQLSQHVDAAIFSVLRDVSRLPKIHEAYERLANLGVRMLGTVVAGTKTDRDPSYTYPYVGSES